VKTYRNLFDRIASFENLLRAARKAQLGKRFKESTALFNLNLEKELLSIQKSLLDRTYLHGPYQDFFVFDPKRRLISAAPYRDRVVHHALCNVIEPIFERSFIHDSYACRKGKGSHAAVRRYMDFARKNRSQLLANVYLDGFDHFVKENLRCKFYIRYVDDFVVFDNSKEKLSGVKAELESYLGSLRLRMHRDKSRVSRVNVGFRCVRTWMSGWCRSRPFYGKGGSAPSESRPCSCVGAGRPKL
jgi:retron-type reverse transcriptase